MLLLTFEDIYGQDKDHINEHLTILKKYLSKISITSLRSKHSIMIRRLAIDLYCDYLEDYLESLDGLVTGDGTKLPLPMYIPIRHAKCNNCGGDDAVVTQTFDYIIAKGKSKKVFLCRKCWGLYMDGEL